MTSTHLKQRAQLSMEQRLELAVDLRRLADGPKVTPEQCKEAHRIVRDLEKLNRLDRTRSALDVLRRGAKSHRRGIRSVGPSEPI